MNPPPPPPPFSGAAPVATRPVFQYDGSISSLYGVFLLNLLLTVVTLGIFRFWAIARLRRYLWSHTLFEGTRFTYTGLGKELFFGFLLAMLILGLVFSGIALVATALIEISPVLAAVPVVLGYIAMFILFAGARFAAQRYRLSRTEWRGIRGGMEGSALKYGVAWLLYLLATIVTLYQAVPWMQVGLARRRISATRFGSAVFGFDGRASRLYLAWLGTIVAIAVLLAAFGVAGYVLLEPTLAPIFAGKLSGRREEMALLKVLPILIAGLLLFGVLSGLLTTWYWARTIRLIIGHTTATIPGPRGPETLRFSSTVTAGSLLWLVVSNGVIALVTLGFGLPILLHRSARYFARSVFVTGALDAEALVQSTLARPRTGEGFLQALDPGAF